MKTSYDIIIKPIITEKSSALIDKNLQYTFAVDVKANKVEIKNAIEEIFNVKVVQVRTVNVHRKAKRNAATPRLLHQRTNCSSPPLRRPAGVVAHPNLFRLRTPDKRASQSPSYEL